MFIAALEFTLGNFCGGAGAYERIVHAFVNSGLIATLATVLSLMVTVSSGYMLSRLPRSDRQKPGLAQSTSSDACRISPGCYRLYFVTQSWGIYDTYLGLLLPHIAVHICFFSWLMKGFFDGIDPSMEYAAFDRWLYPMGSILARRGCHQPSPAISALAVLCWLFTWKRIPCLRSSSPAKRLRSLL